MKERYPDAELGDDVEIFYYLFPMDREVTDDNEAKPERSPQPRGEEAREAESQGVEEIPLKESQRD